jgi:serine/threonine protein phosphatase PrpC
MKIESFALSDIGRVRQENQDSSGYFPSRNLFVVADGMGGHKGGKQASELAVTTVDERCLPAQCGTDPAQDISRLVEAVRDANRRIVARAAQDSDLSRMGTTLVALLLDGIGQGAVVHVGDSRAYRLRDERLELLTTDHTLVSDLLRNHDISEAEASAHPYRHVLTRALGAGGEVSPDVRQLDVRSGDLYLLCSDGVSGMLSEAEIKEILVTNGDDPEAVCRELIAAANQAGGKDNATAITVRCAPD